MIRSPINATTLFTGIQIVSTNKTNCVAYHLFTNEE